MIEQEVIIENVLLVTFILFIIILILTQLALKQHPPQLLHYGSKIIKDRDCNATIEENMVFEFVID